MVKSFFPILFASLFSLGPKNAGPSFDYKEHLHVTLNERNNYTLESIDDIDYDNEFRLYRYNDLLIDEISDNVFDGIDVNNLVLTNSITHISSDTFNNSNIKNIRFTGSKEEFDSLNLDLNNINVSYYAVDEGFINYWNKNIRPIEKANICDISEKTFNEVYSLYSSLSKEDLAVVNEYEDSAKAKIADSMKELVRVFVDPEPAKKNNDWNQTGAIILIIFIAVLGMTSITIFYLLKTKNLIG